VVAVEDVRVQIGAIWPGDRADVGVDCHLCEQVVVSGNLFEYWAPEQRSEINQALGSIRERESDSASFDYFDIGYIDHSALLGKRVNGTGRFMIDGSFPPQSSAVGDGLT
jgi:hypothetical protein